jgi:hypothetical protein
MTKAKISLSVLKKHYQKALDEHKDKFDITIKGEKFEFVTNYAKYLIQHLSAVYKIRGLRDSHKTEIQKV